MHLRRTNNTPLFVIYYLSFITVNLFLLMKLEESNIYYLAGYGSTNIQCSNMIYFLFPHLLLHYYSNFCY
mgnify:CR=1 FL=1